MRLRPRRFRIILTEGRNRQIRRSLLIDEYIAEQNRLGSVGGNAQSVEALISTRFGNGSGWGSMIGRRPYGEWELDLTRMLQNSEWTLSDGAFSAGLYVRDLFEREEITDILFVLTYRGEAGRWG